MSRWAESVAGLRRVEEWLLPGECLICKHRVERGADALICVVCRGRWTALPHPQCARCGQPEAPGIACRICAEWPAGFGGVVSAVWLDDAAREAVHLLKYRGWRRLAPLLAEAMRKAVSSPTGTTLLAIPLGATRQRSRGYNQSAVLAESLARALRVPLMSGTLRRIRETRTQTALTPEERRANLAGAFRVEGRVPRRPLLVDDVFTTGATLAEAAGALLAAGAETVGAVTFARAARPLADALAAPPDQWTRAQWRRA